MFLIGCAFASLYTNENMGHLGQALDDWSKLDPELMLYLFLPVLIFGEAMTLKWYSTCVQLIFMFCCFFTSTAVIVL